MSNADWFSNTGGPQDKKSKRSLPEPNFVHPTSRPQFEEKIAKRAERQRQAAEQREKRWREHRFALPYRTDGPKVTMGIVWFLAVVSASILSAWLVAVVLVAVAMIAGLQTGHAWSGRRFVNREVVGAAAGVVAAAGVAGLVGVAAAAAAAVVVLAIVAAYLASGSEITSGTMAGTLIRSAVPIGAAAGSMIALRIENSSGFLVLLALVSAYEIGDYLVGSGASNSVEGPLAGLFGIGSLTFAFSVMVPPPFDSTGIILFGAIAAVCCPIGQMVASAVLPTGGSYAPGLRRLDSYLVSAPIWALMLPLVPSAAVS